MNQLIKKFWPEQLSSGSTCLMFDQRNYLYPYFVFASSQGSDEAAHLRRHV